MDKRTNAYEKRKSASDNARSSLKKKGMSLKKLNDNRMTTIEKLGAAKSEHDRLSSIDRKSISIFKRGIHDESLRNAADKVRRMEEAIDKSQTAETRLRLEIQRDNAKRRKLDRRASRAQRRMNGFAKAMASTLKDLSAEDIARGEEIYRMMNEE